MEGTGETDRIPPSLFQAMRGRYSLGHQCRAAHRWVNILLRGNEGCGVEGDSSKGVRVFLSNSLNESLPSPPNVLGNPLYPTTKSILGLSGQEPLRRHTSVSVGPADGTVELQLSDGRIEWTNLLF